MIVCCCKNVSDRAVRAARADGATTVEEIGWLTGAGTGCGACKGTIARILAEPLVQIGGGARAANGPAESIPARAAAGKREG